MSEMFIKINVRKSAEGDSYYYDLPNGERLIIRDGEFEGIYNPELDRVLQ